MYLLIQVYLLLIIKMKVLCNYKIKERYLFRNDILIILFLILLLYFYRPNNIV
jgi:hypothetical protein